MHKKSWHTGKKKNQEKVWLEEEKANEESKKVEELQKQIEEERKLQELRDLQAAGGEKVDRSDLSLNWMYEGSASSQVKEEDLAKEREDYLLGKVFESKEEARTDIHAMNSRGEEKAGAKLLAKPSPKNDTFSRLHEDPLLAIKKREMEERNRILNDPVLLAQLRESMMKQKQQPAGDKDKKSSKKSKEKRGAKERKENKDKKDKKEKKEKKDKKKHKKHKKSKRKSSSSDESDGSSDDNSVSSQEKESRPAEGPRKRSRFDVVAPS